MKHAQIFMALAMTLLLWSACQKETNILQTELGLVEISTNPSITGLTDASLILNNAGTCIPDRTDGSPGNGGNDVCPGGYAVSSTRIDIEDLEDPHNGTVGPITWSISLDGRTLSWSGNVCGLVVIVKGSNASYIYTYSEDCKSGTGLISPPTGGMNNNTPEISNITFCWNTCAVVECKEETAFGGSTKGGGKAWWYYFDTTKGECQDIYAGQKKIEGGTVCYKDGKLTINLGDWSLQAGEETVKIQGYAAGKLPTSRQPAGKFTTYKGTSLEEVPVGNYRYYVIHLDVELCK